MNIMSYETFLNSLTMKHYDIFGKYGNFDQVNNTFIHENGGCFQYDSNVQPFCLGESIKCLLFSKQATEIGFLC